MLIDTGLFRALFALSLRLPEQHNLRSVFDFLTLSSCISGKATEFLASSPPFVTLMNSAPFVQRFGVPRMVLSLHFSADPYPNIDRKQLFQSSSKQVTELIGKYDLDQVLERDSWASEEQEHFRHLGELLRFLAVWRSSTSGKNFFARESTLRKTLLGLQQQVKTHKTRLETSSSAPSAQDDAQEDGTEGEPLCFVVFCCVQTFSHPPLILITQRESTRSM